MKDFDDWNNKKIKIDSYSKFKHPKEKEIWWCRIGLNVGSEVFGKGKEYTRPVLIVNAEGSESFIGIPLTSNIKNKKYACILETKDKILHTALVYQVRSFDKRRLKKKIYDLDDIEYSKVQKYFQSLWKI